MEREIIQNSIIDSMETILGLVANINSTKGVIPQIDIDLLKEQIRKLYQDVHNLDDANQGWKNSSLKKDEVLQQEQNEKQVQTMTETLSQEKKIQEEKTKNETEHSVVENIIEPDLSKEKDELIEQEEVSSSVEKRDIDIVEITDSVETEDKEADKPIKELDLFAEPISVADKFSKAEKSINEKLSEDNSGNVLNQNVQKTPISNLKTAIGINDKFMFVNELFQGDMRNYDIFIREINDMEDRMAAMQLYSQKLENIGADPECLAAIKLSEYIERKFL